jgi:hypothetical protein
MAIFAIMAWEPKPELDSVLSSSYPSTHYHFADRVWFVAGCGAARDVAEKLNVRNGGITGVIVMPITGDNYGVASADLWNWLRSAAERPEGRS